MFQARRKGQRTLADYERFLKDVGFALRTILLVNVGLFMLAWAIIQIGILFYNRPVLMTDYIWQLGIGGIVGIIAGFWTVYNLYSRKWCAAPIDIGLAIAFVLATALVFLH